MYGMSQSPTLSATLNGPKRTVQVTEKVANPTKVAQPYFTDIFFGHFTFCSVSYVSAQEDPRLSHSIRLNICIRPKEYEFLQMHKAGTGRSQKKPH